MASTPESPLAAVTRAKPALIGGGLLVIVLGFGLPRLTPDIVTDTKTAADAKAVPAAPRPAPAAPVVTPEWGPGIGVALARLVGSLLVVCGLCVGAMYLINRRPAALKPGLEMVASLPVDTRCVVYLVQAGDRRLLVGLDAGGVKALVELTGPPPEPVAAPPRAPAETAVVGPVRIETPATALVSVAGPGGATAAHPARPSVDEITALINRLRKAA